MPDLEELIKTYKQKITASKEEEKYKNEVIEPNVNEIFNKSFKDVFKTIIETLNQKVNSNVISYKLESKNRFSIEGKFHRIIFQIGKTEIINSMISVNIIPLCIWKGVTKHLGPISFIKDLETDCLKWDLPVRSVESYAKILLGKLAEDEDFYM